MEWILELALVGLLLATMFHAVRLERALGVLKRDRAALEELVAGFNASTRAAEQGIERLKDAADGAGRQIARQVEVATRLKDDLVFLTERGDGLADRLDHLVRAGRSLDLPPRVAAPETPQGPSYPPLHALPPAMSAPVPTAEPAPEPGPRLRSQAERDLMRALRLAR
jgi:hypothetical protein